MTSMTSCIVGKKIRLYCRKENKGHGPGPLELFPFVVLAILMAMTGGINEHMLTSWSSLFSRTRVNTEATFAITLSCGSKSTISK